MASWVDKLSPSERFQTARERASRLVDLIIELVRLHEGNRIVTYTDTLARQIPMSLAGNAYRDFSNSMFCFEVLRLCALWDKPARDRESIPTVMLLLDSEPVLALVDEAIANDWGSARPWDEFGRRQVAQIQSRLRKAKRVAANVQAGLQLGRLRAFRDKFLAHSLSKPLSVAPKYGDETRLLNTSIELVNRLYLATYNSGFMFDNSIEHAKRSAEELWHNCTFSIPQS